MLIQKTTKVFVTTRKQTSLLLPPIGRIPHGRQKPECGPRKVNSLTEEDYSSAKSGPAKGADWYPRAMRSATAWDTCSRRPAPATVADSYSKSRVLAREVNYSAPSPAHARAADSWTSSNEFPRANRCHSSTEVDSSNGECNSSATAGEYS
jgi:hypothetical protein